MHCPPLDSPLVRQCVRNTSPSPPPTSTPPPLQTGVSVLPPLDCPPAPQARPHPAASPPTPLSVYSPLTWTDWDVVNSKPKVAAIGFINGVDAASFGCINCYAYVDVALHGSIDYFGGSLGGCGCLPPFNWPCPLPCLPYLNEMGAYLEGAAKFKINLHAGPTITARSTTTTSLIPQKNLPSISLVPAGVFLWVTPGYSLGLTVTITGSMTVTYDYAAWFDWTNQAGLVYNKGTVTIIKNFPQPTYSFPTPTWPQITGASAEVKVTLSPKLTLAVCECLRRLPPPIILSYPRPPSPSCSPLPTLPLSTL